MIISSQNTPTACNENGQLSEEFQNHVTGATSQKIEDEISKQIHINKETRKNSVF